MSSSLRFMSTDSIKNIEEIATQINNDAKKMETIPRFGYFSIPYSSYVGDRYYSQDRKKIYRTAEKKVITEPRGIYTTILKKGKFSDAFFSNMVKEDKHIQAQIEQLADKEKQEYMSNVKKRTQKDSHNFKQSFLPAGPQEYKDLYLQNPVLYNIPIDKVIDKTKKIDKERKSVFTENRGIFTNPPHMGTSSTPGILFSEYKEDKNMLRMKPKKIVMEHKNISDYEFKPASLKNEAFQKDKELYGEGDKQIKELINLTKEKKKQGKPKYEEKIPEGCLNHVYPFKPASIVKTVMNTINIYINILIVILINREDKLCLVLFMVCLILDMKKEKLLRKIEMLLKRTQIGHSRNMHIKYLFIIYPLIIIVTIA